MRTAGILVSAAIAVAALALTPACAILGGDEQTAEERICTPGAYVFCRCADQSKGTKLCKDGFSFDACATNDSGECAGGEVDDPDTGKDVDDQGRPFDVDPDPDDGSNETCPGKAIMLNANAEIAIEGDTTGAKDDLKGRTGACSVGNGSPDHVYRLSPTVSGTLNVKVQGSGSFDPTVYIRRTCTMESDQAACGETTGPGGLEQVNIDGVLSGNDYYLVIDGKAGSAGKYTVTAKLTQRSFCGDGIVDPNEACDDKNKIEGDGCSNNCARVDGDPPAGDACPGHVVHVWPGREVEGKGTTIGEAATPYGNSWSRTGTSCAVASTDVNVAEDHIYEVTPHADGNLVVTAAPSATSFNLQLIARSTCNGPSTQVACANAYGTGVTTPETMTVPVKKDTKVYVGVEGILSGKGAYTIKFKLQ